MYLYSDFSFGTKRTTLPKFPMRLKSEGTKLGDFYNALALNTIGETQWNQMKNGNLNWSMIDDIYFKFAEILCEQLETYDPKKVEITPEKEEKVEITPEKEEIIIPKLISNKKKKKRDRRVKIKDR